MEATPDFSQLLQTAGGPRLEFPAEAINRFHPRRLKRGEHWLRAGHVCTSFAYVASGLLRAYVTSPESDQTRWAFVEGTFLTSIRSFGLQVAAEEYIVAETEVELLEISFADWELSQTNYPPLRTFWLRTVMDLCGCYERRLHSLLIGDAGERYQYFLKHYPEFVLKVPQKYVAEMLGIAPRHLSRIRKSLATG